jgi:hypothetical protein
VIQFSAVDIVLIQHNFNFVRPIRAAKMAQC